MRGVQSRLGVFLLAGMLGAQAVPEQPDKYQWLEDVSSERSMSWVKAENEKTAKVLESDPRFGELQAAALKLLESPERLPVPTLSGGEVLNTWRDADHVNGILRKTSLADYLTEHPHWQTILDYDALGRQDHEKWVAHGRDCLYPGDELCLINLSAGGEDASTMREFNMKQARFTEGGFTLPHSKQSVSWLDRDSLLVARDWGPGTTTKSGYPFVLKLWKRGTPLENANEIFRGKESDVRVSGNTFHDGQGHTAVLLNRSVTFFEGESWLLTDAEPKKLGLPAKFDTVGLVDGQLIFLINQDWTPAGKRDKVPQGSVIALDLAAVNQDPAHLTPKIVFAPTATEFAQEAETTKSYLLLTTLDRVQGRAYVYARNGQGSWSRRRLPVPDNETVSVVTTNWADDKFFLSLAGFLTPSSLLLGDAGTNTLKEAKSLPAQFDASKDMVEQREAVSKDGTKVPYFLVRRKDLRYDGTNPTLLTAYGGFQISQTPYYSPIVGKLWLERGGVYVSANIRGGGEFGPAWHEAGLKTHRQVIYDDFAAVGRDLVQTRITSPRRLGITGGSNGGLLMGVEMTQHPEMWNAILIQIPLLDMLRFEHIAAGSSWVGEYGSTSVPEERTFLASISPYNQLKPDVSYPEPLLFTTTKDDRVGPVHARKFAARMAEFNKPYFYNEITEGGHGAGADEKERAKTEALHYVYLIRKLMD